jgi:hypothetical protein
MSIGMFEVKVIMAWFFLRFLGALIVFQILGLATPLESGISPIARLVALAAIPGPFELLVGLVVASD